MSSTNGQVRDRLRIAVAAIALTAVMVTTFATTPAVAQGLSATEEIIVTARRREESLQKVPIAITAYSGDQLIKQGVRDVRQLALQTPSLRTSSVNATPSHLVFSLRGQSVGDASLLTSDPAVGLYFNDINVIRTNGMRQEIFDIERVEILKGPQGTLFGRNTTGGLVNIITKRPDYDGIHGYVEIDAGNHGRLNFGGAANLPVIDDKLALRVAFHRSDLDGFAAQSGRTFCGTDDRTPTGVDLGAPGIGCVTAATGDLESEDNWSFRGSMLFEPNQDFKFEVIGDWLRMRKGYVAESAAYWFDNVAGNAVAGLSLGIMGFPDLAAFLVGCGAVPNCVATQSFIRSNLVNAGGIFTNHSDFPQYVEVDAYGIGGIVTIDLADNVSLKSITGFRSFSESRGQDIDGTPFFINHTDFGERAVGLTGTESFSQEINVSGTGMEGRLDWQAGAFYSTETGRDASQSALSAIINGGLSPFFYDNDLLHKSWALFSQMDYELVDRLTLTVGGRYTEESREVASYNRRLRFADGMWRCDTRLNAGLTFDFVADFSDCARNIKIDAGYWSWLGSVQYEVTDDVLVYAKTARGARSGNINARGIAFVIAGPPAVAGDSYTPTEPEFARDIEVGLKGDFVDGRLRTNVAAYMTKYSNQQVTSIFDAGGGSLQTIAANAASSKIKGVEAEVTASPFEGFTLHGVAGYLLPEYKAYSVLGNAATCTVLGLASGCTVVRDGFEFHLNRRWNYSISGRYEHEIGFGVLGLQGDWAWLSKARPEIVDPLFVENPLVAAELDDAIGLLNVRVDYDVTDWGVNLAFYMRNALNKEYRVRGLQIPSLGVSTGTAQEPRMWGFQVRKRFGNE